MQKLKEIFSFKDDSLMEDSATTSSDGNSPSISSMTRVLVHPRTDNPDKVYDEYFGSGKRVCNAVQPLPLSTPKRDGFLRFVCVSDTHGKLHQILDKIPDADVFVHAGDFTMLGKLEEVRRFNESLGKLKHAHKLIIAGNHELSFDPATSSRFCGSSKGTNKTLNRVEKIQSLLTNCTYLEDSAVEIRGVKVYGSPYQPAFHGWAFNVKRGETILRFWDKIPTDCDVLITHGPPLGHGDWTATATRAGCVELLNTIEQRVRPRYHVFGHIHEGYGLTTNAPDGVQLELFYDKCCDTHFRPDCNLSPSFGHSSSVASANTSTICDSATNKYAASDTRKNKTNTKPNEHENNETSRQESNEKAESKRHTVFINCSICTLRYRPEHDPVIFDVPIPHGK